MILKDRWDKTQEAHRQLGRLSPGQFPHLPHPKVDGKEVRDFASHRCGPEAFDLTGAACQAWRESVRCIGRFHWRSLHVVDARSLGNADSISDACVGHLRSATKSGGINPTQTVFPAWNQDSEHRIRIWNHQRLRYAGYRQTDGRRFRA